MTEAVSIDVPVGIDADLFRSALQRHATRAESELRALQERESILRDDAELARWAKLNVGTVAVVRAMTYHRIERYQEMPPEPPGWRDDPRRPVVMRGAKWRLILLHSISGSSCANGWCMAVVERYIRRLRLTAFTVEEYETAVRDFEFRCYRKYRLTQSFSPPRPRDYDGIRLAYINGTLVRGLTLHQHGYLRGLHEMRNKMARLETKITKMAAE